MRRPLTGVGLLLLVASAAFGLEPGLELELESREATVGVH